MMEIDNQYLTYTEYIEFGGSLEKTPFNILEYKAQKEIDKHTFGRLKNLTKQNKSVKMCCFELINLLNSYTSTNKGSRRVSSESTDGYSVTYNSDAQNTLNTQISEIKNIIKTYLYDCKLENGTPYLYAGVDVRYDY